MLARISEATTRAYDRRWWAQATTWPEPIASRVVLQLSYAVIS